MALNLPIEDKLAASINRRRIVEEQRKQRIFNSKQRQIGIDVKALNYQVHNSLLARAQDEEREKQFADQAIRNANLAKLLEQQKTEEIRAENKKIDEYRQIVQRPEYRRDFDLYDPELLRKERPPRISDKDECPVSSLQKLEGEDLGSNDRKKKKRDQVRDFLLQQMHEKRLENCKRNKEINDWEKFLLDQDKSALYLAKREAEYCRKSNADLNSYNKNLALQNSERQMHQKMIENMEKRKDIEYNFYGPILSEDPSVGWKGMSKHQLNEIHRQQLQQITDNQRQKEEESREIALWDEQLMNQEKLAMRLENNNRKQKYNEDKNLELINQGLSRQQLMHNAYLNNVAFKNVISKDFFSQFNTTSR